MPPGRQLRRSRPLVLALTCLVAVWASAGVAVGEPAFELGTELLVTDVGAARLVGYGTVGEHVLELRLASVSSNVRVLVVAPDGSIEPFLGEFVSGRLVLVLADGRRLDLAERLALDDRDLVFVRANGQRVLVPVEGRLPVQPGAEPPPRTSDDVAAPPSAPLVAGDDGDDDDGDDDDDDDDDDD